MPPTKPHLPAFAQIPTGCNALLTLREAAAILRSSLDLVRAEVRDGRLSTIRIGKRAVRVARADIEAYVNQRRVSVAAAVREE